MYQPIREDMFLSDNESDPDDVREEEEDEHVVKSDPEREEETLGSHKVRQEGVEDTQEGVEDTQEVVEDTQEVVEYTQEGVEYTQEGVLEDLTAGAHSKVLEEYILEVRATGHWMCRECGKASKLKGAIKSHVEDTHLTKVLKELAMEDKNNQQVLRKAEDGKEQVGGLDNHIMDLHSEEVQCQLCKLNLSTSNLREHILKEHLRNKFTDCRLCEQKFANRTGLKNHIKQMHLSKTSSNIHRHNKFIDCSHCEQKFAKKDSLKTHIKQVHLSKTSICQICNKEYKDLYHHKKYFHEKIKNYECSYCSKKFQAQKFLFHHIQGVHLGEKTNCPDCKRDISVDNFSRHVKEVHKKIKKPCPQCGKEFSMSGVKRHIRQVHTNESRQCPDCGKYITIGNLYTHIRSVHNKLKKICDLCDKEFPFAFISVHKRKVHDMGKPIDHVTPRGPHHRPRKGHKEEFDELMEDKFDKGESGGQH